MALTGGLIENVGQFSSMVGIKRTSPTATTHTETLRDLNSVDGWIVQIYDSGNRVKTSDADITVSGNVMTIAAGGTFTLLATDIIHIMAWGSPNA